MSPLFLSRRRNQSGMALVIVLSMLVLITTFVVGLLMRANSDHTTAVSYRTATGARQLADTAVNLVQAQINQATTLGNTYAWASQPGAIRTYDNSGALYKIFRLYSSPSLTATLSTDLASDLPSKTWNTSQAVWVDLNAPVITSRSAQSGTDTLSFPIFNPRNPSNLSATLSLDGLIVASTVSSSLGSAASGWSLTTTATQSAPMPVQWLYVLQNGQIVAPSTTSGTVVTVSGANTSNPIVGRIAFWADDETCKVNINTAGGDGIVSTPGDYSPVANATFWAPPTFCATDDVALATSQPAIGEFQRYPGHPATVAFNNILSQLGWSRTSKQFYNQVNSSGTVTAPGVTPRYGYGGSVGGSLTVDKASAIPTVAGQRLYSSVAEMLFDPSRNPSGLSRQQAEAARFVLTAHSRAPEVNLFGLPRISIWPVWDPNNSNSWTTTDKLLAFCATTTASTPLPYYFTRTNSTSVVADISLSRNQKLLTYLDGLTASTIPGYGGYFQQASKYGQTKTRQILTEIFDYVRTINMADPLQTPTSQYARTWNGYPSTQQHGYCQVAPSVNTMSGWNTQGIGAIPRLTEVSLQFVAMASNLTTATSNQPLSASYSATSTPSISMLIGTGDSGTAPDTSLQSLFQSGSSTSTLTTSPATWSTPHGTTAVQAFLWLQMTNPAPMFLSNTVCRFPSSSIWVRVQGLKNLSLNGHSLFSNHPTGASGVGDDCILYDLSQGGQHYQDFFSGPVSGLDNMALTRQLASKLPLYGQTGSAACTRNPFYSAILPISATSGTMSFQGATLTISFYDGSNTSTSVYGNLIQTYIVTLPATSTFPIPTLTFSGFGGLPTVSSTGGTQTTSRPIGMEASSSSNSVDAWALTLSNVVAQDGLITYKSGSNNSLSGNVVQSMVLSTTFSDPRMLATTTVSSSAFTTHPLWGKQNMAHSLVAFMGTPLNPSSSANGMLVNGISMSSYAPTGLALNNIHYSFPVITPTVTNGVTIVGAGDWDNGLGDKPDGPWINKADEGNNCLDLTYQMPYFGSHTITNSTTAFFSPNRQIPSPGMLGSLPTGVDPSGTNPKPWQTLLFRPGPGHSGASYTHVGETTPPDHLFLDLFWMPVAEPYAISEPFSTAGKINLNYQIVPFSYITRSMAQRAVLACEKIAEVGGNQASYYKMNGNGSYNGTGMTTSARYPINMSATLKQFDDKFNGASSSPDIFHSASQICEIYLVPKDPNNYASASAFASDWYATGTSGKFSLVGDNVRERPYTNIYGKITTKSNTYTVYYTVQVLKNSPAQNQAAQWDEAKGSVTGEYRGSTTLERFIDPNTTLPDFATASASKSGSANLETYYKWRVIENHQFAP